MGHLYHSFLYVYQRVTTLLLLKHWWFWHVPQVSCHSCRCAWSPVGGSFLPVIGSLQVTNSLRKTRRFVLKKTAGELILWTIIVVVLMDIWWSYNDYWLSYEVSLIHLMINSPGHYIWLVLSTFLKNMSSSVGMMTFPTEWKVIN